MLKAPYRDVGDSSLCWSCGDSTEANLLVEYVFHVEHQWSIWSADIHAMVPRGTADIGALEARIRTLESQLEHAQRLAALGTVAAMIAHEFNNILTPIVSYAAMSKADPSNLSLAGKAIERAFEGGERAGEIAQAILDFVRFEESDEPAQVGGPRPTPATDPIAVLDAVRKCLARDGDKDNIRISVRASTHACAAITPVCLQQVLLNLLLNARRAIGRSGGTIEVAVTDDPTGLNGPGCSTSLVSPVPQTHDGRPHVQIRVADSGCGMSAAMIRVVAQSFGLCAISSGAELPAERPRGNGLGLAICKQIIARAGGGMWVESTPGKGTTFTILLPAAEPLSARVPAPSQPPIPGRAKAA